tara:strand:- start:18348 stop:18716 length:369 start_codon:yes stop_codon:yes gene_type:complete
MVTMSDGTCKHCKNSFQGMPYFWIQRYLWKKYVSGENPFVLVSEGTFRKDILTVNFDIETLRRDKSNAKWIKDSTLEEIEEIEDKEILKHFLQETIQIKLWKFLLLPLFMFIFYLINCSAGG